MEPTKDDLISSEEAARILEMTRQGVGYLIRNKRLKASQVGKRWVLRRGDVEDYRDKQQQAED